MKFIRGKFPPTTNKLRIYGKGLYLETVYKIALKKREKADN